MVFCFFVSFPQKLEKINRAREQGWRNVLSAGGSGEMKVGLWCQCTYTTAFPPVSPCS